MSDLSCAVVRLFTLPRVPTGMKTGVSTTPWGVVIRPRRAAPSEFRSSNVSRDSSLFTHHSSLLLQLHLLHPDRRREAEDELVVRDRLVDLHVRELVARRIAVTFDVLELRGQVALP